MGLLNTNLMAKQALIGSRRASHIYPKIKTLFVSARPSKNDAAPDRLGLSHHRRKAIRKQRLHHPYYLPQFDPVSEGFGRIEIDLTPRMRNYRKRRLFPSKKAVRLQHDGMRRLPLD